MKTTLGKITKESDGFQVRFERTLSHSIETVWDAITNPDKMKFWFTDVEMELKPGGKLIIRFRDEARTPSSGEVITVERPTKFAFTWEGELAEWDLFDLGKNQCKLIFTYSKLSAEYAVNAPAGFHSLVDRLEKMLNGSNETYPFGLEENDPEHLRLQEAYEDVAFKNYPELERFKPIIIRKTYNAPVEKVWKAITDKNQMKQWYFELSEFKPEVGFEFQFYGIGHKGEQYLHLCKVTEVIVNKKLTYTWSYQGFEGMSYVTFDLTGEGDKTHIVFKHTGLHTFPDNNPDFAKSSFNGGWTELIGSLLKDFVEK